MLSVPYCPNCRKRLPQNRWIDCLNCRHPLPRPEDIPRRFGFSSEDRVSLLPILGCTASLVAQIVWRPTALTIVLILGGAFGLTFMMLYLGKLATDRKAREDLGRIIVSVSVIVVLGSAFVELVTRLLSPK